MDIVDKNLAEMGEVLKDIFPKLNAQEALSLVECIITAWTLGFVATELLGGPTAEEQSLKLTRVMADSIPHEKQDEIIKFHNLFNLDKT